MYIKACKFSGSLRYTTKTKEVQEDKYPVQIKGGHTVEVINEKRGDYFFAEILAKSSLKREVVGYLKCKNKTVL